MAKIKPATIADVVLIAAAELHLRQALREVTRAEKFLKKGGASRWRSDAVKTELRHAIKSAGGALRHVRHRVNATQQGQV